MGQCYTVKLKFKPKDDIGALNALLEKIDKDEHAEPPHGAHYHLEDGLKEFGLDKSKLVDVLKIVMCERGYSEVSVSDRGWVLLTNSFDASYGWHGVMIEAFEAIAPYLEDKSRLDIWPDEGKTTNIVRDGMSVDPYHKPEPELCDESVRYKGIAKRIRVTHNGDIYEFNVHFINEMCNAAGWCGNVYKVRKCRSNTLNACVVYEHVRRNRSKRYEILIYNKEGYEIIMPKQVEIIKYLD